MSHKLTCPKCGEVHVCDECGKTLNKPDWLRGKIVHDHPLASTPIVWGEWCSLACFQEALAEAVKGREIAA